MALEEWCVRGCLQLGKRLGGGMVRGVRCSLQQGRLGGGKVGAPSMGMDGLSLQPGRDGVLPETIGRR